MTDNTGTTSLDHSSSHHMHTTDKFVSTVIVIVFCPTVTHYCLPVVEVYKKTTKIYEHAFSIPPNMCNNGLAISVL